MVNNLLFEDELKRIGFIMNYDSKKLVSENIESSKNLVVENKINNLFSTPTTTTEIITETTLRKIFSEQWELKKENTKKSLTEQWARLTDQIGYWKILFTNLTAGGIGVKWEVANDPVKSTFMYWGPWVIWKDVNKNGGWPISFSGADKKLWLFKFQGGKYAGQPAATMIIESKFINSNFNLGQWGKVTNAVGGPQLSKLMQSKPKAASTAQACKTVDGKPIAPNQIPTVATQIFNDLATAFDGAGTYEGQAVKAYKQITCKPILDAVNAKVAARGMKSGTFGTGAPINNVGDWAKDEMSDYDYEQFRTIWAGLQKLGYKAPPVNQAMKALGVVGEKTGINDIDRGIEALASMTIEDVMEGFRGIVNGIGGTVATLILSVIPGGQAVNALIYGVLTAWDFIQKGNGSSKFSWFNLIVDSLSLVMSAIGAGAWVKATFGKAAPILGAEKSLAGLFAKMSKTMPKAFQFLESVVSKIAGGAKWVVDGIKKGVAWLISKMSFLAKWKDTLLSPLNKISAFFDEVVNAIAMTPGGKQAAKILANPVAAISKTSGGQLTKKVLTTTGASKYIQAGAGYLGKWGKTHIVDTLVNIEAKLGKEAFEELDKKVARAIETWVAEEGKDLTIEAARPLICAKGKIYCSTFDILMNAVTGTVTLRTAAMHGGETGHLSHQIGHAGSTGERILKQAGTAKAGVETAHYGENAYNAYAGVKAAGGGH